MVLVIICIVPYGLLLSSTSMNVHWGNLALQVLMCPCLVPLFMLTAWSKATGKGLVSGKICRHIRYSFNSAISIACLNTDIYYSEMYLYLQYTYYYIGVFTDSDIKFGIIFRNSEYANKEWIATMLNC